MKKVYFATRARGFFKHLFASEGLDFKFEFDEGNLYELNNKSRILLSKFIRSKLFDLLGIIQVIKVENINCDIVGSYNRFIKSDKPYFIYVENPTALFHYSLGRNRTKLGRMKINRLLNDKNLKSIVCMSKACYDTFEIVCGKINKNKTLIKVIYPLVPKNKIVDKELIKKRCFKNEVNLLFIAQGIRFISKGGLEVIEAYNKLISNGRNVNLTVLTSINDLEKDVLNKIRSNKKIRLLDFNLTYEEMEKLYANSTVLLQPTSDESFGLTILEGLKAGLPVIATNLYAIPEMVKNGVNGFLTDPKYWFYDKNNIPNPHVWDNRKNTIHSKKTDERLISFIYEKISYLDDNRDLLEKMSLESYKISQSPPFDESTIVKKWNNLLSYMEKV